MLTAIKGEIESNRIIMGDFNTALSKMDRSSRIKINKETQAFNDTATTEIYTLSLHDALPI